ncbi:MAG: hypothetical protein UT43_C0033G0007 [Parcubacteria group bacterium GW2011_GWC1_39_29]|uniref:Uncharacterized protein n=1 Tax=Candidatus Yanofskybacteria bacterium GW2011_GWD1_39_16 TaxID=1619030 RepID=A0A837HPN4_9BACT|nr:MAG: hypothetical protein UT35_C0011G0003 [Candidatus Yanofskybacteria bacterium GW2011_GWD1_39_16]KKR13934.1 MAG: hypothetical protein UT43_C0033G0007 [Parcubacteria group bacterium GW2011_GWC1_39_29]
MAAMEQRADIATVNINDIPDVARSLHAADINKANVHKHHVSYTIRVRYRELGPAKSLVLFRWTVFLEFHIILPDVEGVDDRAEKLIDFILKTDPKYVARAIAGTKMHIVAWRNSITEGDKLFMFRGINWGRR